MLSRFSRTILAASLCTGALLGGPSVAAGATGPVVESVAGSAQRPRGVNVRAATFNIKNVVFARNPGKNWKQRRKVIIRQVLRERIGVLGIQEANYGRYLRVGYPDGPTQYLDLVGGLNRAGGHYRVTRPASFNCVNPHTPNKCRYLYRGASSSTRILYDSNRYDELDSGAVRYRKQSQHERYFVWAKFKVRKSGHRFFFSTTHLTHPNERVRLAQALQSVRLIRKLRDGLPVIATGDYNFNKFHPIAAKMLPKMRNSGFGDVLNQRYLTAKISKPRAERTINAWISSWNGNRTNVRSFALEDARDRVPGSFDWIFASKGLRVKDYEVVVDYDRKTLRVRGMLPSDHNMVRATISLN